jgi:hypothetical protein
MNVKGLIAAVTLSFLCFSSSLYAEQVEIPEGTRVQVRLEADLLSSRVDEGSRVDFVVARPVIIRGLVAIPAGAVAWGAVQSVKKDKFIKFDIEGVRLPDLTNLKLRTIPEKSKNPGKDLIKVDTQLGDTAGAPKGDEFTAYVDSDTTVEARAALAPASAPAAKPTPVPVQVARPPVSTPATTPAAAASPPAPTAPPAPPAPPPARTTVAPAVQPSSTPAVPTVSTGEPITVECFTDPTDADILIDGDFYGTTPSILKVPPGTHRLEFRLEGYKTYSESLNLGPGASLRTIRSSLQKKE